MTWSPNIPIPEALKLVKMVKNGRFYPLLSFCDWDVWTPSHFRSLLWWGRLLGTLKHSFLNLVLSPRCLWHCAICTIFKRFAVLTFSISTMAPLCLCTVLYCTILYCTVPYCGLDQYTPLVEVNQAIYAWSFRQKVFWWWVGGGGIPIIVISSRLQETLRVEPCVELELNLIESDLEPSLLI